MLLNENIPSLFGIYLKNSFYFSPIKGCMPLIVYQVSILYPGIGIIVK
jgi:hypothetical protein